MLAASACALVLAAAVVAGGDARIEAPSSNGGLDASIAEAPLAFEPDAGRSGGAVEFRAGSVAGGTLYLAEREAILSLPTGERSAESLRLRFAGADPRPEISGLGELPGRANSFVGDDPSRWRSGIPTYERVRYGGIYPGIDLDFYGNQRHLEYDYRLAPGADPDDIGIELRDADSARLTRGGDLLVELGDATVRQRAPVAYQEVRGERRSVPAAFELDGTRVGFELGPYDEARPLVIDPLVLGYSTYLGGGSFEAGKAIAIDASGAAYVAGDTNSSNFPLRDQFQADPSPSSRDAFVTKFELTNGALTLAYSTYLGGTDNQSFAQGIAVDPAGAAYVTGGTLATDFPTEDAFQGDPGDGTASDVFLTKLNPDSGGAVTLGYSTYLGGSGFEDAAAVAVDELGTAYIAGQTGSPNFPVANSFQPDQGGFDAFAAKFNPEPADVMEPSASDDVNRSFTTYLGGSAADGATGVAIGSELVDPPGITLHPVYVTGGTQSSNFPTQNAFQGTAGGGPRDAFVTKLDLPFFASAVTLQYSTYLGGGDDDAAGAIAVDGAGSAYVTGETASANFPTQDALQGDQPIVDAFVTKLDPAPSGADPGTLAYSTYLGGAGSDVGNAIAVDPVGAAYVTGGTGSGDFPGQDPLQGPQGLQDAFVAKLQPGGAAALAYSTHLGGGSFDVGEGVAVDAAGVAYVTGETDSADFPTAGALFGDQPQDDIFVARLDLVPPEEGGGGGDTDPPETTITKGPKKKTKKKKAKFEFSADEPGAGFQCSVDGGPFAACVSPLTVKVKKKPKKHTFSVRAIDAAGNADPTPATHTWKRKKKKRKK